VELYLVRGMLRKDVCLMMSWVNVTHMEVVQRALEFLQFLDLFEGFSPVAFSPQRSRRPRSPALRTPGLTRPIGRRTPGNVVERGCVLSPEAVEITLGQIPCRAPG